MSESSQTEHDTNRITISLSRKNYNKLKELGFAGESFDTVIGRLLENMEGN